MPPSPGSPFRKHLDCLKDPRRHNTRHLLNDILLIALCALISGADSWTQVAEYGRSKLDWFKEFHDDIALFFQEPAHGPFETLDTDDGSMAASKPGGISPPTKSAGGREKTSGRGLTPSVWRSGNGKLRESPLLKPPISSPASTTRPPVSPKPSENIGVAKTACTGAWI
jgi:hypothetical protein